LFCLGYEKRKSIIMSPIGGILHNIIVITCCKDSVGYIFYRGIHSVFGGGIYRSTYQLIFKQQYRFSSHLHTAGYDVKIHIGGKDMRICANRQNRSLTYGNYIGLAPVQQ